MMKHLFSGLFLLLVVVACGGKSETKATDEVKSAEQTMEKAKSEMENAANSDAVRTCSLKKDVRKIEVVEAGKGCEVMYTKFGETKSIATSALGMAHCNSTSEKIAVNLAEAGFSCK